MECASSDLATAQRWLNIRGFDPWDIEKKFPEVWAFNEGK